MKIKRLILSYFVLCSSFAASAQKVTTITSPKGDVYAAISSDGMPKGYENKKTADLYYEAPLYQYMTSANETPQAIKDGNGNQAYAKRMVRHRAKSVSYYRDANANWVSKTYNPNEFVPISFAIAPDDIYLDGTTTIVNGSPKTMNWATAAGFLLTGNSLDIINESSATPTGCSVYQGKNGNDSIGTWRLPTQKEMMLIAVLYKPLLATSATTGFTPMLGTYYWTATEDSRVTSHRMLTTTHGVGGANSSKTALCNVRCIRDITFTP